MTCTKRKQKPSIFGKNIDQRCPGYTTFQKFLVWIGLKADPEQNERFDGVDAELREKGI
jgi:hypothetical protein